MISASSDISNISSIRIGVDRLSNAVQDSSLVWVQLRYQKQQ